MKCPHEPICGRQIEHPCGLCLAHCRCVSDAVTVRLPTNVPDWLNDALGDRGPS